MNPSSTQRFLSTLPSFGSLGSSQLEKVSEGCREIRLHANGLLFSAGSPCDAIYATIEGKIRLYRSNADGQEQVVHFIRDGNSFGEAALLSMKRYPVSAAAGAEGARLLRIDGEHFLKLFESDSAFGKSMVSALSSHLIRMVDRIEDLAIASAGTRLARYLLKLPAQHLGPHPIVELPFSKQDLAAYLAVAPETLSRMLRRWQDQDWIATDRQQVSLKDVAALETLAHF